MSDIHELIARFRRAGALIEFGGGNRVRFKTGAAPVPPELLDELKARKAEVIAALSQPAIPHSVRSGGRKACPEFVGSRTILRHPGYVCGRCGNRYDRHAEAGRPSAPADRLAYLQTLLRR